MFVFECLFLHSNLFIFVFEIYSGDYESFKNCLIKSKKYELYKLHKKKWKNNSSNNNNSSKNSKNKELMNIINSELNEQL